MSATTPHNYRYGQYINNSYFFLFFLCFKLGLRVQIPELKEFQLQHHNIVATDKILFFLRDGLNISASPINVPIAFSTHILITFEKLFFPSLTWSYHLELYGICINAKITRLKRHLFCLSCYILHQLKLHFCTHNKWNKNKQINK